MNKFLNLEKKPFQEKQIEDLLYFGIVEMHVEKIREVLFGGLMIS